MKYIKLILLILLFSCYNEKGVDEKNCTNLTVEVLQDYGDKNYADCIQIAILHAKNNENPSKINKWLTSAFELNREKSCETIDVLLQNNFFYDNYDQTINEILNKYCEDN